MKQRLEGLAGVAARRPGLTVAIVLTLARAGTLGTFRTIPPTAQEVYFPEVYGRGEGSLFTVVP